jgi:hypothetical protein
MEVVEAAASLAGSMKSRMRLSTFHLAGLGLIGLPLVVLADSGSVPTIDLTAGTQPSMSIGDAVDTVREGTHFVSRVARMYHTPGAQQAILVFENLDDQTKSGPMIALPNLNLMSMESVKLHNDRPVDFRLSGTVTEYKGHNYILIDNAQTTAVTASDPATAPARTVAASPAVQNAPLTPLPRPAQTSAVPMTGDSATRTMDRLLAPPPNSGVELPMVVDAVPVTRAPAVAAGVAPDTPPAKIVREGTHLINRLGRLNHTPGGAEAILTFDTDGKTMGDPPMIIQPNLKLASMEGAVLGRAGDLHFRVSGTVMEYKGKNFILLDKAVAVADVETPF